MSDRTATVDPERLLAHGDFVRAVARSLLWDEHAAEDVVQQTWLAALGAPPDASRGWLGTVARNLAIKRLRGDRRRVLRETTAARPEGVPSDADVLERERLRRDVVDAVLALPEPYRATLLLRYFEELPPREAARRQGVPVETVRTRTRRGIELLRARLDAKRGRDRKAFCAALAAWAGPRTGGGLGPAGTTGGTVMGMKTVAALGAAALAVAAFLLWPRDETPPVVETATTPAATKSATPPARETASRQPRAAASQAETDAAPAPAAPAAARATVKGRVADTAGKPAAGFELWITGPPTGSAAAPSVPSGNMSVVKTGADGLYEAVLSMGGRCQVRPSPVPHPEFSPVTSNARDVATPAEGVDFVVERFPTATLVVTAFDLDQGKPLRKFVCATPFRVVRCGEPSPEGVVLAVVRLENAAGDTVKLVVGNGEASVTRDIGLRAGDRVEVRIEFRAGASVAGRVTDAGGRPLAEALVFFGEEDVGRGDEPFKPFDEKRVREGVRTDADGRFELRGKGGTVTVWHASASPMTVARDAAATVTLPARGSIRGVLRGADGAPAVATKLYLDRGRETTTDAEGRFEFRDVESGTRGLSLTGGKPKAYLAAVRVAAGEAADVDLRPGLVEVRVEWPGRTNFGRAVCLVPLGRVGSLSIGQPGAGGIVFRDALPGAYALLCEGGGVATVDVASASATAVVGRGSVVVRAKAGTRVYVVPAGADWFVRLMAGRVAAVAADRDGVARFDGLAPGRWDVGVERAGVRATVEVKDGVAEATID